MKRIEIDENFYDLMDMGFDRRLTGEKIKKTSFMPYKKVTHAAAEITSDTFELKKTKKEQLEALKQMRLQERQKIFRFIPGFLHKYIDYVNSLKVTPDSKEQRNGLVFSAFFSFIVWANQGARSSFMYFVVGNLITMSMLLQRGMPKMKLIPGQKRQVGTWSALSFQTAVCLTLLFTLPSFLLSFLVSGIVPKLDIAGRAKAAMIITLFSNSILSSYFEVFEEKSKSGSRWKKSMKGFSSSDMEAKISSKNGANQKSLDSAFIFPYDPEVDENPYQPKYLDELPGALPLAGQGDLDETEAESHFVNWRIERENARKPPITKAEPEEPWVGGKVGMFPKSTPDWLNTAFGKGEKILSRWRSAPRKYKQDFSEFELVATGPFGFRDKHPSWLDAFGSQIWEEQLTMSRKAARAFGTYRKTMWKIDKEVELQSCDGADKEKEKPKE